MLVENGAEILRAYAERAFNPAVREVAAGVWHVLGIGHSNATIIEGATGVILVDCFDTLERGERLKEIVREKVGKEVHTIIYTHGHPDHRGGAEAFSDSVLEVIAFAPKFPVLERTEKLTEIQMLRGARQFGYGLSDEEAITQALGPREGIIRGEKRAMIAPRPVYDEDVVEQVIDGVKIEMRRLPGETDDTIAVWLPEKRVLCCGDNYYGCFPNLYAIRGSQYRNIAEWIKSLDVLQAYKADALLPGHTEPILGVDHVAEVLGNFRAAIDWILETTLAGMNAGNTIDALASEIRLPEKYASLPYLGEHYGCTEWTVRAIYTAYLGWFDGNPTSLHPLAPKTRAEKTIALAGGRTQMLKAAQEAFASGDDQWCMELCDMLLADTETEEVRLLKADAMEHFAERETSANGRHYYIACAKEIREKLAQ